MRRIMLPVDRGVERTTDEMRAVTVKGATGIRTEMLPADPYKVAALLKERRSKPANRTKAKMVAAAKARGL